MLKGRICPYCHIKTEYKNSVDIYGADYGMIYICPKCRAYVGVHKGTDKAKGRLANEYLRRGWGRCCSKSCAAQLREKMNPRT